MPPATSAGRRAGVLMPLFSLRSRSGWGLGEIPDLEAFSAWAADAGFSVVQLLPVNEPSHGQSSPYGALTAFALDPAYLSLERVADFQAAGGLAALSPGDADAVRALAAAPAVDWNRLRPLKDRALAVAWRHFAERVLPSGGARAEAFAAFAARHAHWLDDYALFVALKAAHGGRAWWEWEPALAHRDPAALAAARDTHSQSLRFHTYVQWLLDEQWLAARRAAEARGVSLMGDLPFVVAGDSADVWSRPGDFRLDAEVGVPPDAFSADGQAWGLPVYRWDAMERGGFEWMRRRAERSGELFGLYRVDHVVGLYRTYFIEHGLRRGAGDPKAFVPEGEHAQTRLGEAVITLLKGGPAGSRVIAEDLGTVPDFVRRSLTRLGVPGYRVLRWEKDLHAFRDPARWPALSVATTGTHDTESLAEWHDALPAHELAALRQVPGLESLPDRFDDRARDIYLACIYAAGSELLLVPFQDALGHRERVNVPGTVNSDNWTYRMPMALDALCADDASQTRLADLARRTGRLHSR